MCRHLKQGPAEGLGNYFCQDSTWIYFREHFAKLCWVLSLFHFQKHAKTSQKVVLGLLVLSAPGHAVWQRPRAAGELVSGKNKPHTVKPRCAMESANSCGVRLPPRPTSSCRRAVAGGLEARPGAGSGQLQQRSIITWKADHFA